jgi:hypothetical protein
MMNIFGLTNKDDPNDIYFFQSSKAHVDTSQTFEFTYEGDKLRVENANVNCLFSNLTIESFEAIYNDFVHHLNLALSPIVLGGTSYQLTTEEQVYLQQKIITGWMYFYTINNTKVRVRRSDFTHPYMVDYVLELLDKKFGVDTPVSLAIGSHILRQENKKYCKTVEGRRRYYDR